MEGAQTSETGTATVDCPFCAEPIHPKAKKCKHCGEIVDPTMRSNQVAPQVFMNAGGAAAAAAVSGPGLRPFRHWIHLILTLITGGLWLPIWLLAYLFRNKRIYY